MNEYILEMKDIVKRFPGTLALDNVNFNLKKGEVMALIGENGAGKSTLMNVLMGVYNLDSGEIFLNGEKIENKSPFEALQKGIGMVPQELNLVPDISIAENIFLGNHQKKASFIDWKKTHEKAEEVLKKLNVDIDPDIKVGHISSAYQQLVSIARTIAAGSNIIILDEPTASLTVIETKRLFENIRMLKEEGCSIIMITHHLDEVVEMADRVTIMRDGKMVKACDASELTISDMIYYMANEKVDKFKRVERQVSDEVVLSIQGYTRKNEFKDVNIDVKKGEILGIAGLIGSGRTELFSCIYGLTKKDAGKLYFEGEEVEFKSPYEAIKKGIGLIPEERRKQGMFAELPIYENMLLPSYKRLKKGGFINFGKVKKLAVDEIGKLRVKTPNEDTKIKSLSGGNQQKVIIARWLEKDVKLLIMDEPTRGIDVRAKSEIYDLVRELADKGVTVVVISSEMDELVAIADRLVVMFEGEVRGVVEPREDMKREDILRVALQ